MDSLAVYLGSDHVIQVPRIDYRESCIRFEISIENAIKRACQSAYTGVLNKYRLNLQGLSIQTENDRLTSNHSEPDVIICNNSGVGYIVIFSEKAIRQLTFLDADFVTA